MARLSAPSIASTPSRPRLLRMANTETPSVTAVHNQALPRRSRQPVSSRLTWPADERRRAPPHRPRQGRRHRLFQAADGAHRQSNPEGVGQQLHDVALAHPIGAGQQADPGLHAGPEGVPRHAFRPIGFGQALAVAATQGVQLILDDLGPHRRNHHLLMALGMGIVARQRVAALAAMAGLDRDQPVHLLDGHPRAAVPFVPGLPARRAPPAPPGALRGGGRRPGRGASGAPAGSALAAGQFLLQLRDPSRQLFHDLLELDHTLPQGPLGTRRLHGPKIPTNPKIG